MVAAVSIFVLLFIV